MQGKIRFSSKLLKKSSWLWQKFYIQGTIKYCAKPQMTYSNGRYAFVQCCKLLQTFYDEKSLNIREDRILSTTIEDFQPIMIQSNVNFCAKLKSLSAFYDKRFRYK